MSEPRPPIFVDEHGDIEAYPSVDAAALDVEAIDVAAGEYTMFDANGLVLQLTVDASTGRVVIERGEGVEARPHELARRLRRYVERVGPERFSLESPADAATLAQLVDAVARFHLP